MVLWPILKQSEAHKVSIFGVFLVCIFPHSDWTRRDTPYLDKHTKFTFKSSCEKVSTLKNRFLRISFHCKVLGTVAVFILLVLKIKNHGSLINIKLSLNGWKPLAIFAKSSIFRFSIRISIRWPSNSNSRPNATSI